VAARREDQLLVLDLEVTALVLGPAGNRRAIGIVEALDVFLRGEGGRKRE
jgi:hypothetical protein